MRNGDPRLLSAGITRNSTFEADSGALREFVEQLQSRVGELQERIVGLQERIVEVEQRVDRHSRKSELMPPTAEELAKMARASGSINRDSVPVREKDVPTRTLRRRISPQDRVDLVARYNAGEGSPALSKEYGISKCGLLHLLRQEGVPMRKQPITPEDAKRAACLYAGGLSIIEVVERIGWSYSTVRKSLLESRVPMRPKGIKRRPT